MLISDARGGTFDARRIEALVDRYADEELGDVARVRLEDGSHRLVRIADLDRVAMDETVAANFLASWPTWPGVA